MGRTTLFRLAADACTRGMPKNTHSANYCPLQHAIVDAERCASCQWRTSAQATCNVTDRRDAYHWQELLRRVGV